jgi:alkanesulfonate monooxygenase SsuD/methylene tetrahydromethanopterin reductase-like flavin-dependent oxidoreductase (luciferase family)
LSPEKRVARFIEALSVMQKLWTENDVDFEGHFWKLRKATLVPKPLQKPHPPIWFGAHVPPAIQRAAKYGSGFIGAGSSSTEDFRAQVQTLVPALERQRKDPASFPVAKRVYIAVDRDRDQAGKSAREWFGLYYGRPEMAERVAVWGNPAECSEKLREVIAAGARLLVLNPMFKMQDQLEMLAREVIPAVRS